MSLVICPEIHAAKAAYDIFKAGGNAMDAAIGAAFVQGVTNHLLCGLGGTITVYWYDAHSGRETIVNGEEVVGSGEVPAGWVNELREGRAEASLKYRLKNRGNEVGYQAIMVPSFVRGCWESFQRHGSGRVTWRQALEPAIGLAADGFDVAPYSAHFWRHLFQSESLAESERGVRPKWSISPYSYGLFLKRDGSPYEQGDRFVQADLGRTLLRLAEAGGDDFYAGAIAMEIAEDFRRNGSLVTEDDLRDYPVEEDELLRGKYRDFDVSAQPYSNGSHLIELLQILDHFDLGMLGHNTPRYIETVSRAMRAASSDYMRVNGLTKEAIEPLEKELTSTDRAAYWADRINSGDSIDVRAGEPARGTTHLTAADDEGNVVSLNHSIGFGGSGVATPGLGFLYNGDMAIFDPRPGNPNSIEPKKRFQGGSPLALFKQAKPHLVLGAPGGTRIVTSIIQSVLNVVDHGMDMRTAVTAPRFHSQDTRRIYLEPSIREAIALELEGNGTDVKRSRYQARPQAILFDGDRLEGGSDPRGQSSSDIGEFPSYDWARDPALEEGGGGG